MTESEPAVPPDGTSQAAHEVAATVLVETPGVAPRAVPALGTETEVGMRRRPPVVMLPGMLGSPALWDDVSARLGEIALPWPARIDLDDTVAGMAESVLAQAPGRFVLMGHSLGAIVALEVVRQAPSRVVHLLLVNGSARGANDAQLAAWSEMAERTAGGRFAEVAAELARSTLPPRRRADQDLVARGEAMAEAVGPEGLLRQLRAQATRPDSRASLPTLTVPTTVISGQDDQVCPPPLQAELVDLCPAAELVSVPGGHMLPLEDPDRVAAEVVRVIDGSTVTREPVAQ